MKKVVVVGGGAGGFFTAINIKESDATAEVVILEKQGEVLKKVRASGGGRCNVTNACADAKELVKAYPRGGKELLGPFSRFMTGDTIDWFETRGVPLRIESDGRVFPLANSSTAIVEYFQNTAEQLGVKVLTKHGVEKIEKQNERWIVQTANGEKFEADCVVITAGSSKSIWKLCEQLGHSIVEPVPSLFSLNVNSDNVKNKNNAPLTDLSELSELSGLSGLSVPHACIKICDTAFQTEGSLLITHWGFSGPAILKLSAFSARFLAEQNYNAYITVNWLKDKFRNADDALAYLKEQKQANAKKQVASTTPSQEMAHRLWAYIVAKAEIPAAQNWADTGKAQLQNLSTALTACRYRITGRTGFKDEFVTAGGVELKEIDLKRFESKIHKNLFFAGEVLNIDAITGGYNFQNAWTGAYIVAQSITSI